MKIIEEIEIPHLAYKVKVVLDPKEFYGEYHNSLMLAEDTGRSLATIYLRKPIPKTRKIIPTVAHEVMHVIQYICRNRTIKMEKESEHMGYLMQYILANILGYTIGITK